MLVFCAQNGYYHSDIVQQPSFPSSVEQLLYSDITLNNQLFSEKILYREKKFLFCKCNRREQAIATGADPQRLEAFVGENPFQELVNIESKPICMQKVSFITDKYKSCALKTN